MMMARVCNTRVGRNRKLSDTYIEPDTNINRMIAKFE
jgi:hypothetical protein